MFTSLSYTPMASEASPTHCSWYIHYKCLVIQWTFYYKFPFFSPHYPVPSKLQCPDTVTVTAAVDWIGWLRGRWYSLFLIFLLPERTHTVVGTNCKMACFTHIHSQIGHPRLVAPNQNLAKCEIWNMSQMIVLNMGQKRAVAEYYDVIVTLTKCTGCLCDVLHPH